MSASLILGGPSPSSVVGAGGGGGGGAGGDASVTNITIQETQNLQAVPPGVPVESSASWVQPANPAVAGTASGYRWSIANATGDLANGRAVVAGAYDLTQYLDGVPVAFPIVRCPKPASVDELASAGTSIFQLTGGDQCDTITIPSGQIWGNGTISSAFILNPLVTVFTQIQATLLLNANNANPVGYDTSPVGVALYPGVGYNIAISSGNLLTQNQTYCCFIVRY
jgi:hypothetical protein